MVHALSTAVLAKMAGRINASVFMDNFTFLNSTKNHNVLTNKKIRCTPLHLAL